MCFQQSLNRRNPLSNHKRHLQSGNWLGFFVLFLFLPLVSHSWTESDSYGLECKEVGKRSGHRLHQESKLCSKIAVIIENNIFDTQTDDLNTNILQILLSDCLFPAKFFASCHSCLFICMEEERFIERVCVITILRRPLSSLDIQIEINKKRCLEAKTNNTEIRVNLYEFLCKTKRNLL